MTFAEKVAPSHTALMVIDMQRDYFEEGGIIHRLGFDHREVHKIIDPLAGFVSQARPVVGLTIFTQQTRPAHMQSQAVLEHYARVGMARPVDAAMEDFFGVIPVEGDVIIKKPKYSAFTSTALDGILRANRIQTLIMTGVATNVCVESTARQAFMLDYHVVVPRDLTAGVSEEFSAWSLRNIGAFFGEVVESSLILQAWEADS
jgi:ureidoacrylate peracid hydrolase